MNFEPGLEYVLKQLLEDGQCFILNKYRVDQQCCPGWSLDFLAIPAIYTKLKLIAHKFKIYVTSDLAKKSGVVSGWTPDDFRRDNIAGPHGTAVIR